MSIKRIASTIMMFLLVLCTIGLVFRIQPVKAGMIIVPDDFSTIQAAINAANDGDTVFVRNGTYYENVVVNKTLTLIGENIDSTIIDGSNRRDVIQIEANNVSAYDFTLQDTSAGWCGVVVESGFSNATIANDRMIDNHCGVAVRAGALNVTISNNSIFNRQPSYADGIRLFSTGARAIGNTVTNESTGIGLDFAPNIVQRNIVIHNYIGIGAGNPIPPGSEFSENTIANNSYGFLILIYNSRFFHNSIINNSIQASFYGSGYANYWDNGYPSGGNFWSDYNGTDQSSGQYQNETGSDNIGDLPYVIDANNRDNYPLMRPYVPFENQRIYIRADGNVDPSGAPFQRKGDLYTLTGNISSNADGIVIERNNTIVDGAGYTVQGTALYNSEGIYLHGVGNVTVKNTNVITFPDGIVLVSSWNNNISGNNITNNGRGIVLSDSSSNIVSGNNVVENTDYGIVLENGSCENNTLSGNNITNNGYGIEIFLTSGHNSISENNITANNEYGIWISHSSANSISGNNITNNTCGIYLHLYMTVYNSVFHNSIVNNTIQAQDYGVYTTWDDGYPYGGNCWGDYNGTDLYQGRYENETGSDGIGDTPYAIDSFVVDNYPLMNPWAPPDIAVSNLTSEKTVIGQGYTTSVNVNFENLGNKVEAFNATVYANETSIDSETLMLTMENSTIVGFNWNTSGFAYGNYTLSSSSSVLEGDTNIISNFIGGWVVVTISGDINGDFKVSLSDLVLLANAYGSTPLVPSKWSPNADINSNGVVDLSDLVIMAIHYGQHYP